MLGEDREQFAIPGVTDVAVTQLVESVWPVLQPKLRAELERAEDAMTARVAVGVVVLVGAVAGAVWYLKRQR